jgi:hypothetical protein
MTKQTHTPTLEQALLAQDSLVATIARLHCDRANLKAALEACATEMFAAVSGLNKDAGCMEHNKRIAAAHANARAVLAEVEGQS